MSKLSLEKGLDLALARSRSRLGLRRVNKRLGLISVSWKCGKVSISSRTENQKSRSRLGLAPQGLVYITAQS